MKWAWYGHPRSQLSVDHEKDAGKQRILSMSYFVLLLRNERSEQAAVILAL